MATKKKRTQPDVAPASNPASRDLVRAALADGEYRTTAGIAVVLGAKLPNHLAVRFYQWKEGRDARGTSAEQLMTARRTCIRPTVSMMRQDGLVESIKEGDETLYRLTPVKPASDKPPAPLPRQTAPAASRTGISVTGLVAEIQALGGRPTVDQLVAAMDKCFKPEAAVAWYVADRRRRKSKTKELDVLTPEQLLARAKRAAIEQAFHDGKRHHRLAKQTTVCYYIGE